MLQEQKCTGNYMHISPAKQNCPSTRHYFSSCFRWHSMHSILPGIKTLLLSVLYLFPTEAIEKTALDWNPQGYRRRGRPKRMRRRTIEDEIRSTRRSWNKVKGIAGDRNAWKLFMDALCSTRSKRI